MKKFIAGGIFFAFLGIIFPIFVTAQTPGGTYAGPGSPIPGTSFSQSAGSSGLNNDGGSACNLTTGGLKSVVNCIISFFDYLVILMIAAAVVFVVWGAFQMIQSEEKREAGKQTVIYGVIGLFVMISVWGFVRILQSTFTLNNNPVTPQPLIRAN